MKLATYADGSRDGQLVVVSRDLGLAHYATHIANRLQAVLDDWNYLAPQLQDLYDNLNAGRARHAFAFDPTRCLAPLPRAHTLVQAQGGPGHGVLEGGARGAATVDAQAGSAAPVLQALPAGMLGACTQTGVGLHEALEVEFVPQLAVVTGDLGADSGPERALDSVRLLMLAQATVLRAVERSGASLDLAARPGHAFAPVAVTPDELREAWVRGRVHLELVSRLNGRKTGTSDCASGMRWSFGQLVQHLCRLRTLGPGTVLCAGLQDHKAAGASTGLRMGDAVRSEVYARDGSSLFGAVEQTLGSPGATRAEGVDAA